MIIDFKRLAATFTEIAVTLVTITGGALNYYGLALGYAEAFRLFYSCLEVVSRWTPIS